MINFEKKSYERYKAVNRSERPSMEEIETIKDLYFNKLLIPTANSSKIEISNKEREDFIKLACKEKETDFKKGLYIYKEIMYHMQCGKNIIKS